MVNLIKLFMEGGYVPTQAEAAMIAAHDAMPRNEFYTLEQVEAKAKEQYWMNAKDGYDDLYGDLSKAAARPKRLSAYDRKHRRA